MPEQTKNTRLACCILVTLAVSLSMVYLQLNNSNSCVLVQVPHTTVFFTLLLILSQHSRIAAYFILPLTLAGASSYSILYDFTGCFLHTATVSQFIESLRIHQYILRHIYQPSLGTILGITSLIGIMYLCIFCIRRFLPPVINSNCIWFQALACCYICFSFILFPFGTISQ